MECDKVTFVHNESGEYLGFWRSGRWFPYSGDDVALVKTLCLLPRASL